MTQSLASPPFGNVTIWRDASRHHEQASTLTPLMSVLEEHSYSVNVLQTESEVLQAVLESVPALLVIYLQTSGEQGYEFCRILRRLPRTSALPVVFVGIRDQASELVGALRCGGNEYLQLPIDREECWLRLERHLRTVKLVQSLEANMASLHQKVWSYNHILRQQEEQQISLAKENQALQRLAFTDGLTQLANRRSFNENIIRMWQQAKDNAQPISLLLCDIDYFKRYNDTYGHQAGDVCLQAVSDALVRGAHRQHDQVARYGGEEFAILLPATDSKGAQQVALAVQSELARAQVPHSASLVRQHVSLSIGVCTLEPVAGEALTTDSEHEVLIHGADEALYTAKLRGRDRVVVNSSEGLISIVPTHCHYGGPAEPVRQPTKLMINTVLQTIQTPSEAEAASSEFSVRGFSSPLAAQ